MSSTRLKTLIVDDEPLARRLIREFLRSHADVDVLGECANGFEAVAALTDPDPARQVDLVFLDIQMPRMSGLEVLALTQREQGVIFTTAHEAYALTAFDRHAVDYLLKPFSQSRFDQAMDRARQLHALRQPQLARLAQEALPPGQFLERILVRERQTVQVLPVQDLICAQAQDDYVCLYTAERSLLKTERLSALEAQLDPAQFMRVHRTWLIQLACVERLERSDTDGLLVHLRGGHVLPVARSRAAALQLALHRKRG